MLLAGRGGAGKSTTAHRLPARRSVVRGRRLLCVAAKPQPVAHSLYNSGKLSWNGLHRFPQLSGAAAHGGDGEKALFFLGALYPERLALGCRSEPCCCP